MISAASEITVKTSIFYGNRDIVGQGTQDEHIGLIEIVRAWLDCEKGYVIIPESIEDEVSYTLEEFIQIQDVGNLATHHAHQRKLLNSRSCRHPTQSAGCG